MTRGLAPRPGSSCDLHPLHQQPLGIGGFRLDHRGAQYGGLTVGAGGGVAGLMDDAGEGGGVESLARPCDDACPDVVIGDAFGQERLDLLVELTDDAGGWPVGAVVDPLADEGLRRRVSAARGAWTDVGLHALTLLLLLSLLLTLLLFLRTASEIASDVASDRLAVLTLGFNLVQREVESLVRGEDLGGLLRFLLGADLLLCPVPLLPRPDAPAVSGGDPEPLVDKLGGSLA